jgi:flavin reductase (DIM6/NTAB) family NADH-FMN oxidoreductase RutF
MRKYTFSDIGALPDRFRRTFINSLHGLRPALLLGSRSADGLESLAIFSQILHIGANPPLSGVLFRPETVERHSLQNIRETGFFTLNNVTEPMAESAHQTSARYPQEHSEFKAVGLNAQYREGFVAPFVESSTLQIGLKLHAELPIDANGTILVIGQIEVIYLPEAAQLEDGLVRHQVAGSLAVAGLDMYFRPEPLVRFSYAKPGLPLQNLEF